MKIQACVALGCEPQLPLSYAQICQEEVAGRKKSMLIRSGQ